MQGRTIVLAGGTGGLGLATARLLYEEGARLVLSYRQDEEKARAAEELGSIVKADLTDASDRDRLLDAAGTELYGLVVFAGNPARVAQASELPQRLAESFRDNCEGPLLLAREAAERMKSSGVPGAIVLLSSMQTTRPFAGSTAYSAAKAALVQGALVLAVECRGPASIRVNVVSPGVTEAGMARASVASGKYQRFLDEGKVHRYGRAEDVARAVRFFLEPDGYITGQVLTVDGGLTL